MKRIALRPYEDTCGLFGAERDHGKHATGGAGHLVYLSIGGFDGSVYCGLSGYLQPELHDAVMKALADAGLLLLEDVPEDAETATGAAC